MVQFHQFDQLIDSVVQNTAFDSEDATIEPQDFLDGEKLVVVSQFGQVTDALASDRFAYVHTKQIGGAACGINKAQQHVHGRRLTSRGWAKEAKHLASIDL